MKHMKFTFANNALAGAFLGAVLAHHPTSDDLYADDLDTCTMARHKGKVTIEIDEHLEMIDSLREHSKPVISTLLQLEQAIGEALALRIKESTDALVGAGKLTFAEHQKDSPLPNRSISINANKVVVGCKTFTPKGADMVAEAARKVVAGKTFKPFFTPGTKQADGRHYVDIHPGNKDYIRFDKYENDLASKIVQLADLRAKVLQRKAKTKAKAGTKAKAKPFRIFGTQRK